MSNFNLSKITSPGTILKLPETAGPNASDVSTGADYASRRLDFSHTKHQILPNNWQESVI